LAYRIGILSGHAREDTMGIQDAGSHRYGEERARRYDAESVYDKGDRQQQFRMLVDLLRYVAKPGLQFCDLGCGTGFFTSAFLDLRDDTRVLAVDASAEMLDVAKARLARYGGRVVFRCSRFEDLPWGDMAQSYDVVFSSLALHHLADAQKWRIFGEIHAVLRPGGCFVLFDLVRCAAARDTELLEYLACRDIQRRLMEYLQLDWEPDELAIERVIENDRRMRACEGDDEAVFADILDALRAAGFAAVVQIFQQARIAGFYCAKT
jgi:tRNA (cmo5U34)-methyltransferase